MKLLAYIVALSIVILIFSASSLAAGNDTNVSTVQVISSNDSSNNSNDSNNTTADYCESFGTRYDRINCRLVYGQTSYSIPEVCRQLKDVTACVSVYSNAQACYELTGSSEDKCLKDVAGFTRAGLNGQSSGALRNYVVFLLYDLQGRAQKAYYTNSTNAQQAADLINSIVDAQVAVASGQSSNAIKDYIANVKQKYDEVMPR